MPPSVFAPPEAECPACGRRGPRWDTAPADPPRWAAHRLLNRILRRVLGASLRCRHCHTPWRAGYELPRVVVGYHGCRSELAHELVSGRRRVAEWPISRNDYDWLGEGIYFWEHGPGRAWQWARERFGDRGAVVAVEIRLGRCLDLGDTRFTALLREVYEGTVEMFADAGLTLPKNTGHEFKRRRLDRLIVNRMAYSSDQLLGGSTQTVRCPFEEGSPAYPGGMIRTQSHVQLAVRDPTCIHPRVYPVLPVGS